MFHSRKLNNRINHIHERVLRLVYKDYPGSFDELLLDDNSFSTHHRNLQKLAIEIFKVKLGLAPEIMKNVSPIIENPYGLRNETKFKSRNVHTVRYGIETASFVAPRIWSSIPRSYKECSSVNEFKAKIKFWYPENSSCKLCKNYIYQIGYTSNRYHFFSIWVFFHDHSRITGQQENGEGISLTRHYHYHAFHRHLEISRDITAESSLPHMVAAGLESGTFGFRAQVANQVTNVGKSLTYFYLSFVDASVICESLFRNSKAEVSLFRNTFW